MDISIQHAGERTTVALAGRFTFATRSAFRDVLTSQLEVMAEGGRVIFDLSQVQFVDSAALGMLLLARDVARQRSGTIVLSGATGQVQRMLAVSKFDSLFKIEP